MKPMAFSNKHPMRALNDKCVPLSGTNTQNYFDQTKLIKSNSEKEKGIKL